MQCLRRPFVASFGIWDEIHRKLHRNRASILAARTHKLLLVRSDGEARKRAAFVLERPHHEDRNPTGIELLGVPAWRSVDIDADCAEFGRSVWSLSVMPVRTRFSFSGRYAIRSRYVHDRRNSLCADQCWGGRPGLNGFQECTDQVASFLW